MKNKQKIFIIEAHGAIEPNEHIEIPNGLNLYTLCTVGSTYEAQLLCPQEMPAFYNGNLLDSLSRISNFNKHEGKIHKILISPITHEDKVSTHTWQKSAILESLRDMCVKYLIFHNIAMHSLAGWEEIINKWRELPEDLRQQKQELLPRLEVAKNLSEKLRQNSSDIEYNDVTHTFLLTSCTAVEEEEVWVYTYVSNTNGNALTDVAGLVSAVITDLGNDDHLILRTCLGLTDVNEMFVEIP